MIRASYAVKLARTKLRSKRGVLVTSSIVASLLFAALISMIIIFSGAEQSATAFIKKAGDNQYLVEVSPNIPFEQVNFTNPPSAKDIQTIETFQSQYYGALQQKYKALGLKYDASTEMPILVPDSTAPKTLPENQRVRIDWSSPAYTALVNQKFEDYAKTATNKLSNLETIGDRYGASGYYLVDKSTQVPTLPSLRLIQDNKEDFSETDIKTGDSTSYGFYTNGIHNGTYNFTDQTLLSRYLLTTNSNTLKGIPVVVSAQEAASLFGGSVGIGKEPNDPAAKLTWLKDVQTKLNGQTYQACYRNSTEQTMLQKIQSDYTDMVNNEGNKDYKKPNLIYDYPTTPCGDIIVKEDTRTAAEKKTSNEQIETQKKLGTYVAPEHRMITFQIVGIKYAQTYTDYSKNINEYLKSLLVSQDFSSFALDIPLQMYNSLPDSMKFGDAQQTSGNLSAQQSDDNFAPRVLEFKTIADAKAFLDNETCPPSASSCTKEFNASPYGSNYLILDEIGKLFSRIATIAFPVVLGLAALIIWFTISRIMAENRRETAVYRAMGAKKADVATIYLIYVLLVAMQIAIISIIIGVVAAYLVDYLYGKTLADIAVTEFGIIDNAPSFSLFSLQSPLLLIVVGSIIAISLIASIQPLIRNAMRPPIKDIRDDS